MVFEHKTKRNRHILVENEIGKTLFAFESQANGLHPSICLCMKIPLKMRFFYRPVVLKVKINFYFFTSRKGFGKADHGESRRILLTKYADYSVDISDEGY